MKNFIFLSTIFFAFGGCESASFMGEEIREPRRVIPRSLFIAGFILVVGYIAGTLSLLVALPAEHISGLSGFMTAIDLLARHIGLGLLITPIAVLVAISNVGAASAYLSSTARLPFVAGVHRYLPAAFGRVHPRFSTPHVAVMSYGAAGILFGALSQAGASVRAAYDMLVAMGSSPTSSPTYFCLLRRFVCSHNRCLLRRSVCRAANVPSFSSRASAFYLPLAP